MPLLRTSFALATVVLALVAAPALADLPRTYQVQRIDNPAMIEGKVHVFSGEDGSLLRTILPPDPDAVNAGGPGGDNPAAFGTYVAKIADIGGRSRRCSARATSPAPG